jgi:hypothetical protein
MPRRLIQGWAAGRRELKTEGRGRCAKKQGGGFRYRTGADTEVDSEIEVYVAVEVDLIDGDNSSKAQKRMGQNRVNSWYSLWIVLRVNQVIFQAKGLKHPVE